MSITLQIGPSATARENFIADVALPPDADISGGWEIAFTGCNRWIKTCQSM